MTSSTPCVQKKICRAAILLPLILLFSGVSLAQSKTITIEDFYGDIKTLLVSHYTNKIVKSKLPIPATRRGVEILDGTLQSTVGPGQPPPIAAESGDELIIKSMRIGDKDIEVVMDKTEPPQKKGLSNPFVISRQPRINLRFSRELTTKDLTIENINRLLATAVDVGNLALPIAEKAAEKSQTQVSVSSPQAETPAKADEEVKEQNLPAPSIVGEIPSLSPNIAELTIESPAKPARIYIDGSYSGLAPRTVRLRAGVHIILVVSDGHAPWEQKLFIPGGKASVVRAEASKAMK
jgi:hypothetical protein